MERATTRDVGQVGQRARYRHRHAVHVVEVHDRLEQAEGVRMSRVVEDVGGTARLDEPSGVHDGEPVAHLAHDGKVVADEHDGDAEAAAHVVHELAR
jgi:hypothetical protein